jgi:hypothetical protein
MKFTSRLAQPKRWLSLFLLLACAPLVGSCATRYGGGGGVATDFVTGEPMAGVHVIVYLMSSRATFGIVSSNSASCGPDYHTITDANGKFEVPEDALDLPWRFSTSSRIPSFNVVGYKAGYFPGETNVGGIDFGGMEDAKTGPLKITIRMAKDERTLFKRSEWLSDRSMAGCRCGPMHSAMAAEAKAIKPQAGREEAERRNQPMWEIMTREQIARGDKPSFHFDGVPGPRRKCPL